jgi:hypothetical protein
VLTLDRVHAGFLRFSHSGKEDAIGDMDFAIEVTDDGGGEGEAGKLTVEAKLAMNFRPNNDHPEWHGDVKDLWNGNGADDPNVHTMDLVDGRIVPITNAVLQLADPDSDPKNLTYTVKYDESKGMLLYRLDTKDTEGNYNYRLYAPGDKVTQAEIDSGKVIWWSSQENLVQVDITFTVRDGSLSAAAVPSDREQGDGGIPWPLPGGYTSETNWEKAKDPLKPHEGGIGKWVESDPGSGVYDKWELTTFTLHLSTYLNEGEESAPPFTPSPDPRPQFEFIDNINDAVIGQESLYEGGRLQITDEMFRAWFVNGKDGKDIPDTDPDGDPARLVYRIETFTAHGWILYIDNGKVTYLGQYASFTQQDIIDGKIYYLHDSTEHFSDSLTFSVSDGRNEAPNATGGDRFTFKFDMFPVNDTPKTESGADVTVKQFDLAPGQSADHGTKGGTAEINTDHIKVSDTDGTGNKKDETDFSTPNNLYIVITELPTGTLFYGEMEITENMIPKGEVLTAIKEGGG